MRARTLAAALAPLLFTAVAVAPALAQRPTPPPPKPAAPAARNVAAPAPKGNLVLEITGGVGYTVVNMDSWAGTAANNWDNIAYWGAARLLFPMSGGLRFGVEAGYNYHFWYNYYPGGTSYPYEYQVNATHVAGLVRFPLGTRFTADLGGGVQMFNRAGTHPEALAALKYHIPLSAKLDLPIGVRADAILSNPILVPVRLSAGIGIKL